MKILVGIFAAFLALLTAGMLWENLQPLREYWTQRKQTLVGREFGEAIHRYASDHGGHALIFGLMSWLFGKSWWHLAFAFQPTLQAPGFPDFEWVDLATVLTLYVALPFFGVAVSVGAVSGLCVFFFGPGRWRDSPMDAADGDDRSYWVNDVRFLSVLSVPWFSGFP